MTEDLKELIPDEEKLMYVDAALTALKEYSQREEPYFPALWELKNRVAETLCREEHSLTEFNSHRRKYEELGIKEILFEKGLIAQVHDLIVKDTVGLTELGWKYIE